MYISGAQRIHQHPATVGQGGHAVGHQAKAATAELADQGADLPANAQGLAASRIAGDIDLAKVFASFLPEPEPGAAPAVDSSGAEAAVPCGMAEETGCATAGADDPAPEGEWESPLVQIASEGFAAATEALEPTLDEAETALALPTDAGQAAA